MFVLVLYDLKLHLIKKYEGRQAEYPFRVTPQVLNINLPVNGVPRGGLPFRINVLSIWKVGLVNHFRTVRARSKTVTKFMDTIGHERILFGSDIPLER